MVPSDQNTVPPKYHLIRPHHSTRHVCLLDTTPLVTTYSLPLPSSIWWYRLGRNGFLHAFTSSWKMTMLHKTQFRAMWRWYNPPPLEPPTRCELFKMFLTWRHHSCLSMSSTWCHLHLGDENCKSWYFSLQYVNPRWQSLGYHGPSSSMANIYTISDWSSLDSCFAWRYPRSRWHWLETLL